MANAEAADVVVVGGGVMGCASAWMLAREGARVTVLERSVPGAEASSAAAGILGGQSEVREEGPLSNLLLESRSRYARFAAELASTTGIDVGHRTCGVTEVLFDSAGLDDLLGAVAWQKARGLSVERLDAEAVRAMEPALGPDVAGGVHFADDGQVDPPIFLRALHIAAAKAGATFRSGAYVRRVVTDHRRARGVELDDGTFVSGTHVIVAAGSWSTLVDGLPLAVSAVRPARGQIVELLSQEPILRGVVYGPDCYLVPRDDGRTLVGSTLEFVGYRREVTARAVRDLVTAALRLAPRLEDATFSRAWSSFRPYTDRGLPFIGPTSVEGLVLATGHHRNGILLAPITAEIIRNLVLGRPSPVDLAPFAADSA